jgi:hypothetical protein
LRIKIFGPCYGLSKRETRYYLEWLGQKLLGSRLSKNIDLIVVNREGLSADAYGTLAYVYGIGDEYLKNHRRFRLVIERDIQSRKKKLQTLAHEMVHVKQLARGEMNSKLDPSSWRGPVNYKIGEALEYADNPWEVEAFGREEILVYKYTEHLRNQKISFDD